VPVSVLPDDNRLNGPTGYGRKTGLPISLKLPDSQISDSVH
jgi:hypothetical protein